MRKTISVLAVMVFALNLSACSAPGSTSEPTDYSSAKAFSILDKTSFDTLVSPVCGEVVRAFKSVAQNPRLKEALELSIKSDKWNPQQASSKIHVLLAREQLVDSADTRLMSSLTAVLKKQFLEAVQHEKAIPSNQRGLFLQHHREELINESMVLCGIHNAYISGKKTQDAYAARILRAQGLAADATVDYSGGDYSGGDSSGWQQADSGNVSYKWVSQSCEYSGATCWHADFISTQGCPGGLYVEINIMDSNGSIIDWANATASSLGTSDDALLEFDTFKSNADTAAVSQVSCN